MPGSSQMHWKGTALDEVLSGALEFMCQASVCTIMFCLVVWLMVDLLSIKITSEDDSDDVDFPDMEG